MCQVLRCQRPSAGSHRLTQEGLPAFTAHVCSEHKRELDAGAPWSWDDDGRVLLMGGDLTVSDERVVVGIASITRDVGSAIRGEAGAVRVVLDVAGGDQVRLTVSPELLDELGRRIDGWLGR